jgi:hypothetical protein
MEKWKDIKGYEGCYQISDAGHVKSVERTYKTKKSIRVVPEKIRALINVHGYLYCALWKDNKQQRYAVHRLVALAFIPNPDNLPMVNHLDGDKTNNNVFNLEWCNGSENNLHAYKTGLHKPYNRRGEKNPMYGKHQSESAKEKIGAIHRGLRHTDETKKKMSEAKKGRKFTELHKAHLGESSSRARLGTKKIAKDGIIKYAKGEELTEYLSNGWMLASKRNRL